MAQIGSAEVFRDTPLAVRTIAGDATPDVMEQPVFTGVNYLNRLRTVTWQRGPDHE